MKPIQEQGEEKLLVSKQKAISFNTNIFQMKIFFLGNSSSFSFLGKQGS